MSVKIDLAAETRSQMGKRDSRRVRRLHQKVPAIVYGAHKEPVSVVLDHLKLAKMMQNEAFYSSILTLVVNGTPEKVVVKAIQRHPYKPKVQHLDFLRIDPKEKLTMRIPLHFMNEELAPGIKAGGVISHFINEVEIRCLPADLPEFIEVDLGQLQVDDYVHLSNIQLPAKVELVAFLHGKDSEHDHPVANLHMPHVIAEPVEVAPISPEVEAIEQSAKPEEESKE